MISQRVIIGLIRSALPIMYIIFFSTFISLKVESDETTKYDIFKRVFLVDSNVTFLLIPIYCIVLTIQNKLKWFALIPEIIFSTMTCLWSSLYHMCDAGPEYTKICVFEWKSLYYLDFIFSFQIIHILFVYSPVFTPLTYILKSFYLTLTFIVNVIYIQTYYNGPFDKYFYLLHVVCGFITLFGRIIYLWATDNFSHEMKNHFDFRIGIPAFILAIAGICFKVLTPNNFDEYWWGHSLWHITIGLSIYFAFAMYDISPFLWCIKEKKCHECNFDNQYHASPV